MITFVNDNDEFASTIRLIDAYIETAGDIKPDHFKCLYSGEC